MQRTPAPRPPRSIRRIVRLLALGAALSTGCEDAYEAARAPRIDEVRPEPAPPGARITLVGSGFGLRGERDRVWLGESELAVESWTDTAVLVRLPVREPGLSTLVLRAGARVSAPYPFEVVAPAAADRDAVSGPADVGSDGAR